MPDIPVDGRQPPAEPRPAVSKVQRDQEVTMSARLVGRVILVLVVLVACAAERPASACSCVSSQSPCALLAR